MMEIVGLQSHRVMVPANGFARAMQRPSCQHDHLARLPCSQLVRAAVEGRLPRGINIERLRDAPAEWSRLFEALGLCPQQ